MEDQSQITVVGSSWRNCWRMAAAFSVALSLLGCDDYSLNCTTHSYQNNGTHYSCGCVAESDPETESNLASKRSALPAGSTLESTTRCALDSVPMARYCCARGFPPGVSGLPNAPYNFCTCSENPCMGDERQVVSCLPYVAGSYSTPPDSSSAGTCYRSDSNASCGCQLLDQRTVSQPIRTTTCSLSDGNASCCARPSPSVSGAYSACSCSARSGAVCSSGTESVPRCETLRYARIQSGPCGCQSDSECMGSCRAGESYFCNRASGCGACDCR